MPQPGVRVDFIGADEAATEIYVDAPQRMAPAVPGSSWGATAGAAPAGMWDAGTTLAQQGLDERYGGLYCSSDDKMLFGLCGGLAHKYGVQVGAMRAIVFLLGFFVLWIPYVIGLFLPKLPTKGVPRPM